jgi:hypothetical protein
MVLLPEQVKLVLAKLEFRDALLVFVDGSLGIREGDWGTAVAGLRFREHELQRRAFLLLAPG